jgi:GTP-binding protein
VLVVASKMDVANKDKLAKLRRYSKKHSLPLFPISAVTGEGIEALKHAMAEKVDEVRRTETAAPQASVSESPKGAA